MSKQNEELAPNDASMEAELGEFLAELHREDEEKKVAAETAKTDAAKAEIERKLNSGNPTLRAMGKAEQEADPPPPPEKDEFLGLVRNMPEDLIAAPMVNERCEFLLEVINPKDFEKLEHQLLWAEACNYYEKHGTAPTLAIVKESATSWMTEDDPYDEMFAVCDRKPNEKNLRHIASFSEEQIQKGRDAATEEKVLDSIIQADSPEALVAALRKGLSALSGEAPAKGDADKLVSIAKERAELWVTQLDEPFATFENDGHVEHWPVTDDRYADWLAEQFQMLERRLPKEDTLGQARDSSGRLARLAKQKHEAFVRYGYDPEANALWVDLCDEQWRAVRIDANGWEVVPEAGVRFRRTALLAPLPEPQKGGTLELLRPLANVTDEEWPLYLAFLLGCLLPTGMLPVCYATGSKNSGKSSLTQLTQGIIDPRCDKPVTGLPRGEDFLLIAEASYLQAYNNVSKITRRESDGMCCLVEGASDPRRTLYKNKSLTLSKARRPVFINGIGLAAEAGDLLSRVIPLSLLPATKPLGETEYTERCEAVRPKVLGALYDAVSLALAHWKTITVEDPPRLVDLAKWVSAGEPALPVETGTLVEALRNCRTETMLAAVEASPITKALVAVVRTKGGNWTASSADWLAAMTALHPKGRLSREWPREGKDLGEALARLAPDLSAIGLSAEKVKNRKVGRGWTISIEEEILAEEDTTEAKTAKQE